MNSTNLARVTADTNVFYYLGSGKLRKSDVSRAGEELWATPVNVLEIVAGIGNDQWSERRDAARGIVEHADRMALDPEEHLVAVMSRRDIGSPRKEDGVWFRGAKALANACSELELATGVRDFSEQVKVSVSPAIAAAAKTQHYEGFVSDIIQVCESFLPGYKAAIDDKTNAPVVPKSNRKDFRAFLASPEFVGAVFFAGLAERNRLCSGRTLDLQAMSTMEALRDLAPYCAVYGSYLRELLTARRKPDSNDWGDLELFVYLQPGTFIATGEKKWLTIAEGAGLDAVVRKVKSA